MSIPYLQINDKFKITDPQRRKSERHFIYIVVGVDEKHGLTLNYQHELEHGNPNELTIHCMNRIPFEAIYERGHIQMIDEKKNIEAVENALEFIEPNAPIDYNAALGLILAECEAVARNNDVPARERAQAEYQELYGR